MKVIRGKLTPDDFNPPNLRYDSSCNCVQSTSDGGITWVDSPNQDPRTSTQFLLPPASSSDPRCDAAASLVQNFEDGLTGLLTAIGATDTAIGGASFILTFLDFLTGIGLLVQLFIDFCTVVIGIGVAEIEVAFTSSVYQELKCIVECNTQPNGTFTQDNLNQIDSQVTSIFGFGSIVSLVFGGWIENLGPVGMSNIASQKHITGDCSACDLCSWCTRWEGDAMLEIAWPVDGNYTNRAFYDFTNHLWQGVLSNGTSGRGLCYVSWLVTVPSGTTITEIHFHWLPVPPANTDNTLKGLAYGTTTQGFGDPTAINTGNYSQTAFTDCTISCNDREFMWTGISVGAGTWIITAFMDSSASRTDLGIDALELIGTGTPIFTPNCT